MSEIIAAGDRIAECFGVRNARKLEITPLRSARLAIIHLGIAHQEIAQTVVLPPEDAFLVMLYLVDVDHCDIWPDRPAAPVKRYPQGSICLISLKDGAAISIRSRFEALAFHIPRAHFTELAEETGEPEIENLVTCRGINDQVIRDLGAAFMSMFDMPDAAKDTLLAHVGLAFNAHVAHRYGRSLTYGPAGSGRLSSSQESRIKAFMSASFARPISIEDIAEACGLSPADLSGGFYENTGQQVMQWLRHYRINHARTLLGQTGDTIAQVANACGFPDEMAFVDAFTAEAGVAPGAWRLRHRH